MIRLSRVLTALLFAAVSLGVVAGCTSDGGQLDGTRWKLTGWPLSSLYPGDFVITAAFADGQISGGSGVNTYAGAYKADSGGAFEVGDLAGTLMAGPEPAMRAESAYLILLQQARSFAVIDGTLTLYDEGGNESLMFEAVDE